MAEYFTPLPTYKVLQADLISPADREKAAAITSFIRTGEEAHKLQGHEGFGYKALDVKGKAGIITYKGIEISLLFKREVVERQPWLAEPIPAKVLPEPKEAWIQVDLLDTNQVTKQKGIAEKLKIAMERADQLEILWTKEQQRRKVLEAEVQSFSDKMDELKALRTKVALLQREKELSR